MSRVRIGTGYIFTFAKSRRTGFQAGREPLHESVLQFFGTQRRPAASQISRFIGGKWRMYSGKRSILVRVAFPSALLLPILLLPDIAR